MSRVQFLDRGVQPIELPALALIEKRPCLFHRDRQRTGRAEQCLTQRLPLGLGQRCTGRTRFLVFQPRLELAKEREVSCNHLALVRRRTAEHGPRNQRMHAAPPLGSFGLVISR